MVDLLQAPVPGQSLTTTPRNSPWERPPEMSEVKDVLKYYITKLADDEVLDDLAVVFELGADLQTVTETMVTVGTMNGLHTTEVGMLVGPQVASFIKAAMTTYGMDVKEKLVSKDEDKRTKAKARFDRLLDAALDKLPDDGSGEPDEGKELIQDMQQVASQEEPPMEKSEPKGLMSRGDM